MREKMKEKMSEEKEEFKTLVLIEKKNRIKRIEAGGNMENILIVVMAVFTILMSLLLGFNENTDFITLWPWIWLAFISVCTYGETCLYEKNKNGKRYILLKKYKTAPVNLKLLALVKLYLIVTYLIKLCGASLIIAVCVRFLDGANFSNLGSILIPIYFMITMIIIYVGVILNHLKKCRV